MSGSKGSLSLSGRPGMPHGGGSHAGHLPLSHGARLGRGMGPRGAGAPPLGLSGWGRAVSAGAAGGAHGDRCCRPLPGLGDPEPRGSCGQAWPVSSLPHLPPAPFRTRGTRLPAAGVVVSTTATQGVLSNAEAQLSPGLRLEAAKGPVRSAPTYTKAQRAGPREGTGSGCRWERRGLGSPWGDENVWDYTVVTLTAL